MKIGKLKHVDLRELWNGEAADFTPWLSREENIEQLGEAIGIDLEVLSQEKNVGPFRADILCRSTLDESYVLIENQLERTDHTHLGQILTYAAGLNAVTVIWIAKQFTEEHRAAIDWLNRITDEKFNFFGIEIEVYKIGESDPAPMLKIVSKPNDWEKSVRGGGNIQNLTPARTINLEYWGAMKKYFEKKGTFLKCQKPPPQHWTNFALGKSNFHMAAVSSVKHNFIRVEILIDGPDALNNFTLLKDKYEADSLNEIDENIIWDELSTRKASWVYIKKEATVNSRSDWQNQFEWILTTLEKFDKFFRPKIKALGKN